MLVSVGTMQLTLSIAIIQVTTSCCIHAGFELIFSVTVMLVDLFVAIMQVTVSVTIMQLRFCITYAGDSFCSKYMGEHF